MRFDGIEIPNDLIRALENSKLVVFSGAGVSMGRPTNLPNFKKLANIVAKDTGESIEKKESFEVFLGRLKSDNGIDVNGRVIEIFDNMGLRPNRLHEAIIDIFPSDSDIRIVTTNYDKMFEKILWNKGVCVNVYNNPALPLGNEFAGIVHLHGSVDNSKSIVLTDDDFGNAYMTSGHASKFLVNLFKSYTVLFIGYSYNDIILKYLTRALTRETINSIYIATDDSKRNWELFRITPISYEKGKHSLLKDALINLSIVIKRGLFDWKVFFNMFSDAPPVDDDLRSEIEYCLQNIALSKQLADNVRGSQWLTYLDNCHVFDDLFGEEKTLSESSNIWIKWIVDNFIGSQDEAIKKLLFSHKSNANKSFSRLIIEKVCTLDSDTISDKLFCEYFYLFRKNIDLDSYQIYSILSSAIKRKCKVIIPDLIMSYFDYSFFLKEKLFPTEHYGLEYDYKFAGDYYCIKTLWNQSIQLLDDNDFKEILGFASSTIASISSAHKLLAGNEPWEFEFFSIEGQEDGFRKEDLIWELCDILCNSFEKIVHSNKEFCKAYDYECIVSDSILLRRIGLKLLRENNIYEPEEKINILLRHCSFPWKEKEQAFWLIRDEYEIISDKKKREIFALFEDYNSGDEVATAYVKYNWAVWILRFYENDEYAIHLLKMIESIYPEFKPRKHPELDISFESYTVTRDDNSLNNHRILEMTYPELVIKLQDSRNNHFQTPSYWDWIDVLSTAIKDDNSWTDGFIDYLFECAEFDKDIWNAILYQLPNTDRTIMDHISILLRITDRIDKFAEKYSVTDYLFKIVKLDIFADYYRENESTVNKILNALWDSKDSENADYSNLKDLSLNSTIGLLLFIIVKLLIVKQVNCIPENIIRIFSIINDDSSKDRFLAIFVLCGQYSTLYKIDKSWCEANIIPLMISDDSRTINAAWEGISYISGFLDRNVANDYKSVYLETARKVRLLKGDAKEGFIDMYASLLVYYIANPLSKYIPALFKCRDEDVIRLFIRKMDLYLLNMKTDQKHNLWQSWIKHYWINRYNNIPSKSSNDELVNMLGWLEHFEDDFEEAVDIINSGKTLKNVNGGLFLKLMDKGFQKRYPKASIKLVCFLLQSYESILLGKSYVRKYISEIQDKTSIEEVELQEAMMKSGI